MQENKIKLELSLEMEKAIEDMGFEELSAIQKQAIPPLLDGLDIIGQAQTGTGKTAAFGIPIVEAVDLEQLEIQSLVLCPTRELALQVSEEISKLGRYKEGFKVMPVYGGAPMDKQIRRLKKGVHIVVGTPGRVMDLMRRKILKLDKLNTFVLDEADEMFAMGFRDDIVTVIEELPKGYQSAFFSATLSKPIKSFAAKYQNNPVFIRIQKNELVVPKIDQIYYEIPEKAKEEITNRVLDYYKPRRAIIFCNTKRKVDEVTFALKARGISTDSLHGDIKQGQRTQVMQNFKAGRVKVLVATDVAARGIDVNNVDLVINFDLPQDDEYYVHRIGRTARAGHSGTAISFVTNRDRGRLKEIERYTKSEIEKTEIPSVDELINSQVEEMVGKIARELTIDKPEKMELIYNKLLRQGHEAKEITLSLISLMFKEEIKDYKEIDLKDFAAKSNNNRRRGGRSRNRKNSSNNRGRSSNKSYKSNNRNKNSSNKKTTNRKKNK